MNLFEKVEIVGVGNDAILQFANGATHILTGLQDKMRKLRDVELEITQATGERSIPPELAAKIDDVANLITSAGEKDFGRLRDQAIQISQWSLVGDEDFHALPWELLCAAENRWLYNAPMVRRRFGIREVTPRVSNDDELRILFVTARPSVVDVPPRAVIEPLLRQMEDSATSHPRLTVLRTGTFADMEERLQQQLAAGTPVHIVHLDLHGTIVHEPDSGSTADDEETGAQPTRSTERNGSCAESGDEKEKIGDTPVLIFEREPDLEKGDKWIGGEGIKPMQLAGVLRRAGVQVLVLNACRSASGDGGANFAFHVAKCDIPAVIGIRRRITVDAASDFVAQFYKKLCGTPTASMPVTSAMRQARNITSRSHELEATFPSLFITKSPALPLRPSSSERFDQKLQQIAVAEAHRPKPPPVGRALDERVVRAQVFRRPLGSSAGNAGVGRLGPLQLFGWRGVGKTTFVKSLAAHWVEADLADQIVWRDLAGEPAQNILDRVNNGEDPLPLVGEFLHGDRPFNPQASNVVVVDQAELLPQGEFGTELWQRLTALGSLDNRVIVIGRHQPWAAPFTRGETRRFTMGALDDLSASSMLRIAPLADYRTEILELSGRVPDVLRWFIGKGRRNNEISDLVGALDFTHPGLGQEAFDVATELFSLTSHANNGSDTQYFLGSINVAELAPFGWLADAAWLEASDLDRMAPNVWPTLLGEGLLTEIPLQDDPSENIYWPHPLLPWLGRIGGLHLGGEFGESPSRGDESQPKRRRTYWGQEILV